MATGYDRRQPTRETFAMQPVAPAQFNPRISGQSRGAQLVGGQSVGGVVTAGRQTDAGPIAGQLGAYVEEFMRPHVERRQQEEFFKGFTKAQEGIALEELSTSNSGISRIFGPTAFEQGAQFYTAKARVDRFVTESLEDMDTLKKLPAEELSKVLADKSRSMMTGDLGADQLIQSELIQKSGPLSQAVSKHRYEWQQSEALRAWTDASKSGASALQGLASTLSAVSDPSDQQRTALDQSVATFRGNMAKPEGMDEETYRSGLYDFMRGAMQNGDFYAVEVMRRSGIDQIFDEDEQVKLQTAYERYGNKVLGEAVKAYIPELMEIDADIAFERAAPMDIATRLASVNARLKADTGLDMDLFDYRDIRAGAKSMTEALHATHLRAETRRQQLEDRAQDRAWKLEDDAREAAQETAQVRTAWGVGLIKSSLAQGLGTANDYEMLATNEYAAGNYEGIARAYRSEGWSSSVVKSRMQSRVTNSLGEQYTNDFKVGYQEWAKFYQIDRAAAAEYYGQLHTPMENFHRMVQGGMSPNAAYLRAMGNAGQYSTASLEPGQRKEATEAITSVIDKNEPWTVLGFSFGGTPLNRSSRAVIVGALTNRVAMAQRNSDLPSDQVVRQEYERLIKAGELERYGEFAWRTGKTGATPMATLLKLKPKEADTVIQTVIRDRVTAAGGDPSEGDYEIRRLSDNGKPALFVQYINEETGDKTLVIGLDAFASYAAGKRQSESRSNQPSQASTAADTAARQGLDPYRRIAGENGAARIARINREVAAKSRMTSRPNPQITRRMVADATKDAAQTIAPIPTAGVIAGAATADFLVTTRRRNQQRRANRKKQK